MRLLVINGPNLNMLGIREPDIYGNLSYRFLVKQLRAWAKEENIRLDIYQSNHEGKIIDKIQQSYYKDIDGIIINAGAFTHTSIAILDALTAAKKPAIEVHLTKISEREDFRHKSYLKEYCIATIEGLSFEGYHKAILMFKDIFGGKI